VEVDPVSLSLKKQIKTVVYQAFSMQSPGQTKLVEHIDRPLFQHTRTNSRGDIFGRLPFNQHMVDTCLIKQGTEQKT
jgi:hypothetical protein